MAALQFLNSFPQCVEHVEVRLDLLKCAVSRVSEVALSAAPLAEHETQALHRKHTLAKSLVVSNADHRISELVGSNSTGPCDVQLAQRRIISS